MPWRRTAKLFRRDPARPDDRRDDLLKDVAQAITATPIYFRPALVRPPDGAAGERLVDGAVFANNPALPGCAEASRLARRDAGGLATVPPTAFFLDFGRLCLQLN